MNLPNKLTVLRVILVPVFLIFTYVSAIPYHYILALVVFAAASITDMLDGKIARKHNLVTNFGKFTDPLADKLLVMTAFIVLTGNGVVPSWVTSIIIWRELSVTGLRLLLVEQDGVVLAAKMPGKIKTTTQFIAIIFLLLNNVIFAIWNIPFGQIMLYICLFFTIYSGVDYFIQGRDVFSDGFK